MNFRYESRNGFYFVSIGSDFIFKIQAMCSHPYDQFIYRHPLIHIQYAHKNNELLAGSHHKAAHFYDLKSEALSRKLLIYFCRNFF